MGTVKISARVRACVSAGMVALVACSRGVSVGASQPQAINTLSAQEQRDGWRLLFDGQSISKYWRAYRADTVGPAWTVVDGVMTKTRPGDDIVTREKFKDFEFAWDWKVSPRGNSGVFYRGQEDQDKVYWTAPEFQIADDSLTPDSRNPLTSAGAAYGLYAPPPRVANFGGIWNSSRILVRGNHVEHWMNGRKTIEYEIDSPDWKAKVAASKFKPYPNWGLAPEGVIAIQGDHGGSLELRNLKIRVIK